MWTGAAIALFILLTLLNPALEDIVVREQNTSFEDHLQVPLTVGTTIQ